MSSILSEKQLQSALKEKDTTKQLQSFDLNGKENQVNDNCLLLYLDLYKTKLKKIVYK